MKLGWEGEEDLGKKKLTGERDERKCGKEIRSMRDRKEGWLKEEKLLLSMNDRKVQRKTKFKDTTVEDDRI